MTNRTHRKQPLNINNVMRILFANIGWMEHYKGNCDADMIVGGGDYDDKDKHEAFNFQELNGACYGFVQTVRSSKINLCRIDNTISKSATKIDKVLVVWVASRPDSNGSYIVGWYNNATVYADYQPSNNSARKYPYNITAQKDDCILLPIDSRTLNVPRAATTEKGFLGHGKKHPKIDDFLGNYIALSTSSSIIIIEAYLAEGKPVKKSTHCGLTKEEMEVPVIVIQK